MFRLKNPQTIRILVCMALAAGVLTIYSPMAGNDFINFDDPYYVTKNPHVQDGLSIEDTIWALTANHAANWHPLTWFSHMLDWELFGANPMGHHWTSMMPLQRLALYRSGEPDRRNLNR